MGFPKCTELRSSTYGLSRYMTFRLEGSEKKVKVPACAHQTHPEEKYVILKSTLEKFFGPIESISENGVRVSFIKDNAKQRYVLLFMHDFIYICTKIDFHIDD